MQSALPKRQGEGTRGIDKQVAYRVVAVRASGDRVVSDEQVALDQAEALRARLLAAAAFEHVLIEPDERQAGTATDDGSDRQTVQL